MTATTGFWRSIEAIHDVVYFAPDVKQRYEAIGLKGYWMGYVASRSAALGTPPPELVIATFHGFAPTMVKRSLPAAWSLASRDDILKTRFGLARDALEPALKDADTAAIAKGLVAIVDGLNLAGKPLAAAHAAVPRPDDDAGLLWWAATVIREYRGDCHLAVLTAAGLDGADSNALAVAAGLATDDQRMFRGWTEDEWALAVDRLRTRGWVDAEGAITDAGSAARQQIEDATDRVCNAGIDREATARKITIEATLLELARAVVASGAVTYPIPSGVQSP
jgi:hypothetical protein